MSNYIPRPIDRVINLYTVLEPSKNIIFLEGKQDYQFYSTHAKKLETNLTFSEINTVDFSSLGITFPSNLERNNNRDKIIYLISEIHKKRSDSHVYGIVDRDILEYVRDLSSIDSNLILTDYGCLEVYYLSKLNIGKIHNTYCDKITDDIITKLCIAAAKATLLIIFEKKNALGIPKLKMDSYLNISSLEFNFVDFVKKTLENFKKDKTIDINISTKELLSIEQALKSSNPKNYLNGHYFMDLLLLFLKSMEKKRFQHTTTDQLEDVFRVSVESDFIKNEPLFQKLIQI